MAVQGTEANHTQHEGHFDLAIVGGLQSDVKGSIDEATLSLKSIWTQIIVPSVAR